MQAAASRIHRDSPGPARRRLCYKARGGWITGSPTPRSPGDPAAAEGRALAGRTPAAQAAFLAAVTFACVLPFLGKPFHVDDPLFLWTARQIHSDPLDFYGFEVNWHGFRQPMVLASQNPPGAAFYLAAVAAVAGWSEVALHAGMAGVTLAMMLGVAALARRLRTEPRTAAIAVLAMPGVLVSSTTIMADIPLLALWCWAVVLWIDGIAGGDRRRLFAAAALVVLAVVTKYAALALVPLLLAYALVADRRVLRWGPALLLALAGIAGYLAWMLSHYGQNPIAFASFYSGLARAESGVDWLSRGLVGLAFLGGSLLVPLFFAPRLWSRLALATALAAIPLLTLALSQLDAIGPHPTRDAEGARWGMLLQIAILSVNGVQILALAIGDWVQRRRPDSMLLALWIGGVFVFAGFANWSTNARALIPAAPAVALVMLRRLDARRSGGGGRTRAAAALRFAPLVAALCAALAIAWADDRLARSARTAAWAIGRAYAGRPLWFQGAWGFQYYMEAAGARRVDFAGTDLAPGDVLAVAINNSTLSPPPPEAVLLLEPLELPAAGWIATMSTPLGAGFYSDVWGPLPFALGSAPRETYLVLQVEQPLEIRPPEP